MTSSARSAIVNIITVARREFVSRAGTRTYLVSTLVLVLAAALVALAPVAISYSGIRPSRSLRRRHGPPGEIRSPPSTRS